MQLTPIGSNGAPSGPSFQLSADRPLAIGRGSENDIVVEDPRVARRQAVILPNSAGYVIYDFTSRSNARVNGKRIVVHQLQPGDQVSIGDHIFLVMQLEEHQLPLANLQADVDRPHGLLPTQQTLVSEHIGARLIALEGVLAGHIFALGEQPTHIGRGTENEIVIASSRISRRHAEILTTTTGYVIRDLQSSNGTFVNGRHISTHQLQSGDQITFGGQILVFEMAAGTGAKDLGDTDQQEAEQRQGIRCPGACGRVYPFGTVICPRDGRILANGQTALA